MTSRSVAQVRRARPARLALAATIVLVAACSPPADANARTLTLETLNDSGVTGTAVLTEVDGGLTLVVVEVDPGEYPDMPAHIHPGTCTDLVPQPTYPLANVVDGTSETEIVASIDELFSGGFALNLHASSNDWETYTACAELVN